MAATIGRLGMMKLTTHQCFRFFAGILRRCWFSHGQRCDKSRLASHFMSSVKINDFLIIFFVMSMKLLSKRKNNEYLFSFVCVFSINNSVATRILGEAVCYDSIVGIFNVLSLFQFL